MRRTARSLLAAAVTLQAALGIVTLLYQAPLRLALAHQIMAIVVFTIAVVHAERLSHRAIVRLPAGAGGLTGKQSRARGVAAVIPSGPAQIGDDVGLVLQADRQPHHVGPGAGLRPSARRTIACAWSRRDG